MSEVRTVSATGGAKGVKPERYDLLPKEGLDAMARVYAFGALKYADHNWRRKYEWSKSIASGLRHMMAFSNGETFDDCPGDPQDCEKWSTEHQRCLEHSGEPHPALAMFHMAAVLTWLAEDGEGVQNPMDDRWPATMERARLAEQLVEEIPCGQDGEPLWDSVEAYHAYLAAEEERHREKGRKVAAIAADVVNIVPDEGATTRGRVQHAELWEEDDEDADCPRGPHSTVACQCRFAKFPDDFPKLHEMQDRINEEVARLAQLTQTPALFIDPADVRVQWKDPQTVTPVSRAEASENLHRLFMGERDHLPRWYVNEHLNPQGRPTPGS